MASVRRSGYHPRDAFARAHPLGGAGIVHTQGAPMISDVQKARMERMFHVYDCNHDGFLTLEDFADHTHKLAAIRGLAADSPELRTLERTIHEYWGNLAAADANGDGRVTLDEWMTFAAGLLGMLQQAADSGGPWPLDGWIDSLYGVIDANGDGGITLDEYRDWCTALGIAGGMDVEGIFRAFEKKSADSLSRDEFVAISRQFWLDPSPNTPGARWIGP
jgi:juvenile hormone diol kinase